MQLKVTATWTKHKFVTFWCVYYYAKYKRLYDPPQSCLQCASTIILFSNEIFYKEDLKVLCHMYCWKVKVLTGNVAQCRNIE